MIPTIGVLVATYAIARLLQAPLEQSAMDTRWKVIVLSAISIPAIGIIGFCVVGLILSGASGGTALGR